MNKLGYFFGQNEFALLEGGQDWRVRTIGEDGRNLTLVFLSLNRVNLSIRLLESMKAIIPGFAGKILIADNGSSPGQLAELKSYCQTQCPFDWELLEFGQNFGVAGGRNRAFAAVKTDWILSLDNDIFFIENPLPRLDRDLAQAATPFLSIPLVNPDRQSLYSSGGNLQIYLRQGVACVSIDSMLPPGSPIGQLSSLSEDGPILTSFLFGGASVIRKDAFEFFGRFDDAMLVGFEDLDFSLRLFRLGVKVGVSLVASLIHDHPKAEEAEDQAYEAKRFSSLELRKSAEYMERKHGYRFWGEDVEAWLQRKADEHGLQYQYAGGTNKLTQKVSKKPRIALVPDTDNWAFANISKQIVRHLGDKYDFSIIPHTEVAKLEEVRWQESGHRRPFTGGGGNAIRQLLLCAPDYDIVHIFWREILCLVESGIIDSYAEWLGLSVQEFHDRFTRRSTFTTAVYDHAFLDEEGVNKRRSMFNEIVEAYYVSSERLNTAYASIPNLRKPEMAIEDGVDLGLFAPRNLARLKEAGKRPLVIGWVGNSKWGGDFLDDPKGYRSLLVPAIEQLQAEGHQIILEPADRQNGFIPHHQMSEYYAKIDILACTSLIEGTPNPILEAMACGVPVITTDVGIVPQLFGPRQKDFILPERSIAALKDAILRILKSPALLVELSEENLKSIEPWDWRLRVRKFDQFFEKVLKAKRGREGEGRTKICTLPFTTPSIETDGSVRLCSASSIFDYRDETNMGNARQKGLKAVWQGEKYTSIREQLFTGKDLTPYCDACEYRFDGPVWFLQLHLGLMAHRNGDRSAELLTLLRKRLHRYDDYVQLAPQMNVQPLPLITLPSAEETQAKSYDQLSEAPLPASLRKGDLPLALDLNTLNRCNVSCVMCPPAIRFDDHGDPREKYFRLTLDDFKAFTDGIQVESLISLAPMLSLC